MMTFAEPIPLPLPSTKALKAAMEYANTPLRDAVFIQIQRGHVAHYRELIALARFMEEYGHVYSTV